MRKLLFYATLLLLVIIGILLYNYTNHVELPNTMRTIKTEPWHPARLSIPRLDIDASVMNVGRTETGLMAAPTSKAVNSPYWSSVFWYAPGVAPGQAGNAVIAGHVDRQGGGPAIFWSLATLQPGNKVVVETMEKKILKFKVERVVKYPAEAPAHHLNLVTCSGIWTEQGYDERLVVFTTQVSS
jgi:sortase (surface protein transpeptidase)